MNQATRRYAQALFELAEETNSIDNWQDQVRELTQLFVQEKSLLMFLKNVLVSNKEKKAVLQEIFAGKLERNLLNFLCLLVDKHRSYLTVEILKVFNTLCNEAKGIEEGYVYSREKLVDVDRVRIEESVSRKLARQIQLHNRVDQNLISGVKVVINDFVMDGSLRNRILRMKDTLIKEGR